MMTQQTILVTGAAGFVGSRLSRALLSRGDRVVGVDNLNDYYPIEHKRRHLADLVPDPGVMEELEARLAEASRPGVRFDPVRRRRPGPARPGQGQATLGDVDPAWDAGPA